MRIAIYSRVSTSHQVEHQTIEQQLDQLTAHVQMHAADGWVLDPTHVFRDEGYSGAVLARPGLDRLRDAVKGHEIDRVLVTTPDRLARNYVHQMVLLEEWARAGCLVTFLDRPMSDDPHDHLLLQIRGAVAEYERTLIAERMRRGRLAKLRAGLLLPWTYPPYGYRLDPDRPRDPRGVMTDPAEAAIVAELFALYREPGTSLIQLARHLDQRDVPTPLGRPRWSSPTIRGILRNPTYTGQVYAQRTRYRAPTHRRSATHAIGRPHGTATPLPATAWLLVGQVPALVSQAHFDEVQSKLASNRAFARRNNTAHQYLLRALVSCGCCGLACTARAVNGRSFYYLCNGKGQSTYSHRATRCAARYIPAKQLDELVWQDLCVLLHEPAPLAAAVARAHGGAWLPQELLARRETLHRGQAHLRQQIERLTDAYLRAIIPLAEYERRRSDLERRMQALAGQEALLRNDAARQQELAGVAASLEAFRARVQRGPAEADFERRRQLVMLLIDRVVVTDADVEIRYVLPITPESEHVRFCQLRKDYFDRPAMPLDRDQGLDGGSGRAPGREIRQIAVRDIAPDQQAAGPPTAAMTIKFGRFAVGQFEIRPVIQPWPFAPLAGGQPPPGRWREPLGNRRGGCADRRLADPGVDLAVCAHPEHIALARSLQRRLDRADPVDGIAHHPAERHRRRHCPLDHAHGQLRLGGKANLRRHLRRGQPGGIAGPFPRQIERPVDQSMAVARDIGGKHPDLAVGDLAG